MPLTIEQSAPELLLKRAYFSAEIPPTLLQKTRAVWFVAQTKSRHEKILAQFIRENFRNELFYFLPYFSRKSGHHISFNPLFQQFLFIGLPTGHKSDDFSTEDQRIQTHYYTQRLFASRAVCGYLFTPNQPKLKRELAMISQSSPEERGPSLPNADLSKGKRVRVTQGIYQGCYGKVFRPPSDKTQKVVIDMEVVGHYELTIGVHDLELADP